MEATHLQTTHLNMAHVALPADEVLGRQVEGAFADVADEVPVLAAVPKELPE